MNLSKVSPRLSDLRDLGLAFKVPVVGMDQRGISEAIYSTVVAMVSGTTPVTGSTTASSYEFNVTTYGASGNGIHDDTAAIQTTITTALSSGSADVRPIIRIPPGDYKITSGLDFRHDTVAPHVIANGATISWEPSGTTANQTAVSFGTISVTGSVTLGKVEGLWIKAGTTYFSSGGASTSANWSTSGHTAINIHNCSSWEFIQIGARDMRKGIVLSSSATSGPYVGCVYNKLLISRLVNCKYSISADLLPLSHAFSNQHKIIGGNFSYSNEAMILNEMKGNYTSSCAVLSGTVTPYVYQDCNEYINENARLPWDYSSNFVVVGGLGDWAQVLTEWVDYIYGPGAHQVTLISDTAKAIVNRTPSVLGLGCDKIAIYVTLSHVASDTTYREYVDVTGTLNFTQDARELMVWQGVDKDKTLLRYGSLAAPTDYTVDVANRKITLTVGNYDEIPIVAMDRPRHVTIYADRGLSTPDMWNFDGSSFEGIAEYVDAAYIENSNNIMFVGCRFECEHTRKLGFYLGKASADCHLINGSQTDIDDYHGNKEFRDFGGGTSSNTRLYREVWEGQYLTFDGRAGFRKKNYQNAAVAMEAVSGDIPSQILYVGNSLSWNTSIGISANSYSNYAISAQTKTGTPYYGLLYHDDDYDYAPVLLRLMARTTAIPSLDGKLGGAIQMDGPVAYTYAHTAALDLTVDDTLDTKVTSATYAFQASDIGYQVCISTGSPWTAGNYVISAVVTGSATLASSPAPVGTTGGEFVVRSCITSPLLRIYSRWMTSGYDNRESTTQFYVGDYRDLWRNPLTFTSHGSAGVSGYMSVLLKDVVGVRLPNSAYSGLYVPWLSGDTTTTAYFGDMSSGNNRTALAVESGGSTPLTTNTYSRYSLRSIITDPVTGSPLAITTPLVLAHKSTLDPIVGFGTGIEFRADSRPGTNGTDLVVATDDGLWVYSLSYFFSDDPVTGDVGRYLTISDGVGWTKGKYVIMEASGGVARLNLSPAPLGTSGGTWSKGTFVENLMGTISARAVGTTGHWDTHRASRIVLSPQGQLGAIDAFYVEALEDATGHISLGVPTGLRVNGDVTKALGLYAPSVIGDSSSIPIISVGSTSSIASGIALEAGTYSGTALKGTATSSGTGVLASSLTGYPLIARIVGGAANTITPAAFFSHTCTGAASTGIGTSILIGATTAGSVEQTLGGFTGYWADVADATRRGRVSIWANNTAATVTTSYEGIRVEAAAAGAAQLGFYGATAVSKQTITGDVETSGLSNLLASLATLGLITNSTTAKGEVRPQVTKTSNYPITVADSTILASGTIDITLPTASTCPGSVFTIKNIYTGTVSVLTGETIDGGGTYSLTSQYQTITVQSNGSVYFILSKIV